MKITTNLIGIILVSISAIVWSTLGLFAKGIEASVWVILFYRGLFSILILGLYVHKKSEQGITHEFKNLGWPGWLSAVIGAASTICFISAFKYTSIANVSIIYAVTPFIVSILAWIFLREKINTKGIICATFALVGVVIMVGGSSGSINLLGDALALLMALGMSALVILFRKFPNKPMILSTLISAVFHVLLSLMLSDPFAVSAVVPSVLFPCAIDLVLLVGFGVVFALATILMVEGTRLIPASQSALISTLEAPLAPLWAWLVFMQLPSSATWIGGALVLIAVFYNILPQNKANAFRE
ncbi:MAG: drug/metabolite transporter (DMT)-like permease [Oceanospirillaceae bacterium]|jgi:drug/metabolite transporter (DMT)-like permease